MTLPFAKYHSTGNDFIMIDNRNIHLNLSPKQVHYLCHRRWGIGADGLILIQNHKNADFEMVYYNSDGNLGSFCGNGSRSAVLFAINIGAIAQSKVQFQAYDGLHEAEIFNNRIRVSMNPYKNYKKLNEKEFFLDTGSPHHVIFVEDIFHFPVEEKGKEIIKNLFGK
jgi:diaminopimelate epimerase